METSRKRRGFMKLKLIPLYRAVKHSSGLQLPQQQQQPGYLSATAAHQHQPKPQKVSFVVTKEANNMISRETKLRILTEKLFGAAAATGVDDETVDVKAACYISSRKERFNGD